MRELWGLEAPAECRVYVMTSWLRFLFHSAPWPWRIFLAVTCRCVMLVSKRCGRWPAAGRCAMGSGGSSASNRPVSCGGGRWLRERIFVRREVTNGPAQHLPRAGPRLQRSLQLPTCCTKGWPWSQSIALPGDDGESGNAGHSGSQSRRTRRRKDMGGSPPIQTACCTWPCAATGSRVIWPRHNRRC